MRQAFIYSLKLWQNTMIAAAIIVFCIEYLIYKDEEIILWLMMAVILGIILAVVFALGFSAFIKLMQKLNINLTAQTVSLCIFGWMLIIGTFLIIYGLPPGYGYQVRMWMVYSAVLTFFTGLYKIKPANT